MRSVAIHYCSVVVLSVCLAIGCTTTPPIQEMSDARLAIAAAEQAGAGKHASQLLAEARVVLESAEQNLESKAYAAARRDADSAKRMATEAREFAETRRGVPERMSEQPLK